MWKVLTGFFSAAPELEAGLSRHSVGTDGGLFLGGAVPLLLALEIGSVALAFSPNSSSGKSST